MDPKVYKMLEKAKIFAEKTGVAATQAAQSASKVAGDMAQATKLNLQIFDLNTECEVLYKQMGKLVYDIHLGIDVEQDAMDKYLAEVDEIRAKIDDLRLQLSQTKQQVTCPVCGKVCQKDDVYCASCGAML